jgi:predicted SAM-dependent methyltransferase
VNVDLFVGPPPAIDPVSQPDTLLIVHDLRDGLPLEAQSCEIIYSSHFFEHLSFAHGLKLMTDCYRALRPGGIFRLVLPDFRKSFDAYVRNDAAFFALLDDHRLLSRFDPDSRTFVDYVNYIVYQYGEHVAIYDEEKVAHILRRLGYRTVVTSQHQPGMDPDNDLRRKYSFYIEATK